MRRHLTLAATASAVIPSVLVQATQSVWDKHRAELLSFALGVALTATTNHLFHRCRRWRRASSLLSHALEAPDGEDARSETPQRVPVETSCEPDNEPDNEPDYEPDYEPDKASWQMGLADTAFSGMSALSCDPAMSAPCDSATLQAVFDKVANQGAVMNFGEFRSALRDKLQLDLSDLELERVWSRITFEGGVGGTPLCSKHCVLAATNKPMSPRECSVDFKGFERGVRDVPFLRHIASELLTLSSKHSFKIPDEYDYAASTNDNYRSDEGLPRHFYGRWAEIRAARDYSYHVNYVESRQLWQDVAISTVVTRTAPRRCPWAVYTCGPMGAGECIMCIRSRLCVCVMPSLSAFESAFESVFENVFDTPHRQGVHT